MAYECLRTGTENLRVLVSNERVRVISGGTKGVVTEVSLADLLYCQPMHKLESNGVTLYYIELISRSDSTLTVNVDGPELLRRPKVRCDNEEVAKRVSIYRYYTVYRIVAIVIFIIVHYDYYRCRNKSIMLRECTKNAV